MGQVVTGAVLEINEESAIFNLPDGKKGVIELYDFSEGPHDQNLAIGKSYVSRVISYDFTEEKFKLSAAMLLYDPWNNLPSKIEPLKIISGLVIGLVKGGVFVKIEKGIIGFVGQSELEVKNDTTTPESLIEGKSYRFKVISIHKGHKIVSLSRKRIFLRKN